MEMIKAEDFYYLFKVKNLEREYKKCAESFFELQEEFDSCIHFETCDPCFLNMIEDQKWAIQELMEAIENQIHNLTLAALN
jgi:hypothetical protein